MTNVICPDIIHQHSVDRKDKLYKPWAMFGLATPLVMDFQINFSVLAVFECEFKVEDGRPGAGDQKLGVQPPRWSVH